VGPSLNALRHKCPVIMNSHMNASPSKYDDHEWLASLYTLDGNTIHALIHDEYQAYLYDPACNGNYFNCWYNAITSAISTDGGASYGHAIAPSHRVASIPYPYTPNTGPIGYFAPSNIIEKDGYYYAMIQATSYQAQQQGICLMRTNDLADPTTWRAWDGTGFNVRFISPYREPNEPPQNHVCAPISFANIETMHESLTYNTYLGHYLLVGSAGKWDPALQRVVYGVYYSISDDLINWRPRQLILESEFSWTYACGDDDPIAYPVVLDPDSPSRNFETTGKRMYLYMTRMNYSNCQMTLDRDLIRVPLEVFP